MFSNIEYHKLSLWINKNAMTYLNNLKQFDNLKDKKEKILKYLMTLNNQESNYNELIDYIMKITNVDDPYLAFSSEAFFNATSLEEKVYYLLTHSNMLNAEEKTALIDGLFMYAVQEQDIPMASLLYLYIKKEDKLSKDFLEFLKFDQNIDGSIGIVNPLRDKNISSNEVNNWILFNSIYVYIVLPFTDGEFTKD